MKSQRVTAPLTGLLQHLKAAPAKVHLPLLKKRVSSHSCFMRCTFTWLAFLNMLNQTTAKFVFLPQFSWTWAPDVTTSSSTPAQQGNTEMYEFLRTLKMYHHFVTMDHKTSHKWNFFIEIYKSPESWINKIPLRYGLLGLGNILQRYDYLKIWNLRVQKKSTYWENCI